MAGRPLRRARIALNNPSISETVDAVDSKCQAILESIESTLREVNTLLLESDLSDLQRDTLIVRRNVLDVCEHAYYGLPRKLSKLPKRFR